MHSLIKMWNGNLGIDAHALPTAESLILFAQYIVTACSVFPVLVGHVEGRRVGNLGCVGKIGK